MLFTEVGVLLHSLSRQLNVLSPCQALPYGTMVRGNTNNTDTHVTVTCYFTPFDEQPISETKPSQAHPEVLAFQLNKAAEGGEAGVKLSAVLRELRDNGKEAGILDYGVMQVRFVT